LKQRFAPLCTRRRSINKNALRKAPSAPSVVGCP
jgi:hypothetical protein